MRAFTLFLQLDFDELANFNALRQGTIGKSTRESTHEARYARVGMIARWQPVHLGHAVVLHALCDCAAETLIGVGSANRYDLRNPFTLEETTDMIRLVLTGWTNYTLIPVPDLDDGPRWRAMVVEMFGRLDRFVTANPYVAHLLAGDYKIVRPVELLRDEERIAVDGTTVRKAMAQGGDWQRLVPDEVGNYLAVRQLDERFRREFGLHTLALDTIIERTV